MMALQEFSLLVASLLPLAAVYASPTPHNPAPGYVHPSNGVCIDYNITEEVTAPIPVFSHPPFESNYDIAELLINMTRISADGQTPSPIAGFENATRPYTVSGTFCAPREPREGRETTVLVATHGIMYDRRYRPLLP